jgi:hypothetical protein
MSRYAISRVDRLGKPQTAVVCISGKLADTTNSKLSRIFLIKAIMTYTKTYCDYSQRIQRKFSRIVKHNLWTSLDCVK